MEIGKRYEIKPLNGFYELGETATTRRINGKRFLFRRFETDTHVVYHVSHYSTRHWISFPKESHGML